MVNRAPKYTDGVRLNLARWELWEKKKKKKKIRIKINKNKIENKNKEIKIKIKSTTMIRLCAGLSHALFLFSWRQHHKC